MWVQVQIDYEPFLVQKWVRSVHPGPGSVPFMSDGSALLTAAASRSSVDVVDFPGVFSVSLWSRKPLKWRWFSKKKRKKNLPVTSHRPKPNQPPICVKASTRAAQRNVRQRQRIQAVAWTGVTSRFDGNKRSRCFVFLSDVFQAKLCRQNIQIILSRYLLWFPFPRREDSIIGGFLGKGRTQKTQ